MKKERIQDGITRIREDLIQKAESYEFQKKEKKKFKKEIWMKWIAIAACVCLLMGASTFLFHMGIKIDYGGAKGGGGGGESGTAFMSYAGPVFPLNVLNDTTKIVAERSIDFDFSPYETKMKYYDNFGEETGYSHYDTQSIVTDRYVLTNTTHDEIVLTASYPFVGNFRSGYQKIPSIHVNGKTVETKLIEMAQNQWGKIREDRKNRV